VCASDTLAQDCETITVTVNEINQPPVLAAIGSKQINEQVKLSFTARATDADLPANTLTYTLTNAPAGAVLGASTGAFTWTPTEAQGPGSYTFDVCASDGLAPDCETITVTVNEANQPPVLAHIGNLQVGEQENLTFTASATDADLPAHTLTFSMSGAPSGAAIVATTGVFTWTPTEPQGPGSYPISVCVSDGQAQDCETITVTVDEDYQPPVLAHIGDQRVRGGATLIFTASATDVDLPANTLTFSLVGAPKGARIDPDTGVFTWTPGAGQVPGSYTFDVCVSDGQVQVRETITVRVDKVIFLPFIRHYP
jgi:hypothetical protein